MSLRVWLPLNGSLDNQGLDEITPVLTGAVAVDNEGKIGKCYKFGTSLGFGCCISLFEDLVKLLMNSVRLKPSPDLLSFDSVSSKPKLLFKVSVKLI